MTEERFIKRYLSQKVVSEIELPSHKGSRISTTLKCRVEDNHGAIVDVVEIVIFEQNEGYVGELHRRIFGL